MVVQFLTPGRGQKALVIMELMQQLGIDYMHSNGQTQQVETLLQAVSDSQ